MSGNHLKLLTALSVLTLMLCAAVSISDESDAAITGSGTNSDPYTSISETMNVAKFTSLDEKYILVGSTVNIKGLTNSGAQGEMVAFDSVSSGFGLSLSGGIAGHYDTISGTVSKAGDIVIDYYHIESESSYPITLHAVAEAVTGDPVDSIKLTWTLSSSDTVTMNRTTSIRAIVSPQTASDLTVSWSITENTGSATITREWNDTYNGEYRNGCDIRGDSPGTVTLTATANDGSGTSKSVTITIRPYTYYLDYDPNGGLSPDGDDYSWYDELTTTDSSQDVTFTITDFEPTREGYKFKGWSKSSSASAATYEAGDRITVSYGEEVILYAVWGQSNLTFNSIQSDSNVIVGSSFAYSPTMNVSGCSFSVTGASWLSVSGGTIYGTPTTPGTYNVKVTASCSGYTSASQSFTITVLSSLEFTTSPTNGLIAVER